ncbi:Katanin p80 WD40 repeat-containing subunit B1 [Rhizophlyctis rosea]|nr:Katanin p80 WD40 repeat-containing subunit B1 [Rhizophlyctis rosea]
MKMVMKVATLFDEVVKSALNDFIVPKSAQSSHSITKGGSRSSLSVSVSRGGGGRGYGPGDSEESPEYGYQTGEGPSPSLRRQRSRSQIASQDDTIAGRETPAASASKGVMSFVPAGNGEKLLNLDIAKFVQGPQRRTAPLLLSPISDAPPPTSDTDIMETLLFRHASVVSILRSRLTSIRMVRQVWDESSIRQAVETMADVKDSSVWVDMLRVVNLKPKLVSLDVCVVLLGGVGELLFEVYEDYIVTACQTIRILSKSFANVILSTLNSGSFVSPGVDLVREERSFGDLHATLEELKRAPGNVGVAVRDALKDLQVFGFE